MAKASFSRKQFFIDRSLQGRYMITFLVPMLIMLVFMLLTLYFASQTIISTTSGVLRSEVTKIVDDAQGIDQLEQTAEQCQTTVERIRARVRDFGMGDMGREFAGTLMIVFAAGIFLVVLQVVMMTVFFSHKLAGPVYRFEKMCKDVINGNYQNMIHLRKGDQMQGLALLLNESARVSGQRIIDLEAKIAELEARCCAASEAGDTMAEDVKETIAVAAEEIEADAQDKG